MKTTKALGALALLCAMVVAGAPSQADSTTDVGDFIVRLATAKNLNSADPQIARDSLAAIGVRLPSDLDLEKSLTEGDVATISRLAGLRVTTSRPDAEFSDAQLRDFFDSFGAELGATGAEGDNPGQGSGPGNGNGGPPFDPFTKGQGKKKGKGKQPVTETEPS
jgi:hypothetical protein